MEPVVKVLQQTSDEFLVKLREVENTFSTVNPQEFRGAMEKAVSQQFGGRTCKSFTGADGAPSWVVDISDVLGGVVFYAVVSSSSEGRVVAGFVDEDVVAQIVHDGAAPNATIDNLEPTPQMVDPTATLANSAEVERLAEALRTSNLQKEHEAAGLSREVENLKAQVRQLTPKSDDPVLVRHKVIVNEREVQKGVDHVESDWVPIITTHDQAGNVISSLLEKGTRAQDIEVWKQRSTPSVKIDW